MATSHLMYEHIARGLINLAQSLTVSRTRRLTPNEISLIREGGLKLQATMKSLDDSRTANELLQKQIDRMKPLISEEQLHVSQATTTP